MTTNEMIAYDMMIELNLATPEELNLARCLVNGTWTDVINQVVYARYGYKTLDQLIEAEMEEEEEE